MYQPYWRGGNADDDGEKLKDVCKCEQLIALTKCDRVGLDTDTEAQYAIRVVNGAPVTASVAAVRWRKIGLRVVGCN